MRAPFYPGSWPRLRPVDRTAEFELDRPRLVVAGYTGRDPDAVAAHIAELASIGVPPPPSVPTFYDLDPALLTLDAVIEVDGEATSGEAEPVLIRHAAATTSDWARTTPTGHWSARTSRWPRPPARKPLCPQVIALPSGIERLDWDAITVECRVDELRYQRGGLAALRTPADRLTRRGHHRPCRLRRHAAALGWRFIPGTSWQLTLTTATACLTHSYHVKRRSA